MAETCGWVFVDNVPLLYEKKRVARQLQVETWLYLAALVKELKIQDPETKRRHKLSTANYVV
jgi:hypothetical protein